MRIYLDNCAFNRPFDDQSAIRIRLEAEAKLYVQALIKVGSLELIWSYILDFENAQNPFTERRMAILHWKNLASTVVEESPALLETARQFLAVGIKPKDALHVAAAIIGKAEYFLSTDDRLLQKLSNHRSITAINPVHYIGVLDGNDHRH